MARQPLSPTVESAQKKLLRGRSYQSSPDPAFQGAVLLVPFLYVMTSQSVFLERASGGVDRAGRCTDAMALDPGVAGDLPSNLQIKPSPAGSWHSPSSQPPSLCPS